jgi:hypothetical protein
VGMSVQAKTEQVNKMSLFLPGGTPYLLPLDLEISCFRPGGSADLFVPGLSGRLSSSSSWNPFALVF